MYDTRIGRRRSGHAFCLYINPNAGVGLPENRFAAHRCSCIFVPTRRAQKTTDIPIYIYIYRERESIIIIINGQL